MTKKEKIELFGESPEEELDRIRADREKMYGKPENNLAATGRIVGAILSQAFGVKVPDIPAREMALICIAIKLGRMSYGKGVYTEDTCKDLVNYARIAEELDWRNPENALVQTNLWEETT